jgi:nucleoside-diphosphate-sugar epimerase
MRVFVAGATGVIGQYLVPGLITAGHEVTASTRSPLKASQLKRQGATPVIVDGLDREAVLKAVIVSWMMEGRGASNDKAKRELGWTPKYPSWRDGFPVWAEGLTSGKVAHDDAA